MTKVEILTAATRLPPEEQLELAQRLWDNVSPPAELELSPELRDLLEARREEAHASPEAGVPWPEARARILEDLSGKRSAGTKSANRAWDAPS